MPDFQLIPKENEHKFFTNKLVMSGKILPRDMEFPPLMEEILRVDKGLPKDTPPRLPLIYRQTYANASRVAQEGEKPTININLKPNLDPRLVKYVETI